MKKLLILALLSVIITSAGPLHAQSATPLSTCWSAGNGSSADFSCTLTITANTVLVVGGWFYGGPSAAPVSDTMGLTWSVGIGCNAFRAGSRNDQQYIYYADTGAASGSDTVTTVGISSNFGIIDAADFNTGYPSPTLDTGLGCAGSTSSSAGTISSASATLANTNELVIGYGESGALNSAQMGITQGAGFTNSISAAAPNGAPNYAQGSTIGSVITPMEAIIEPSNGSFAVTFDQTIAGFWFSVGISFPTTIQSGIRHKVTIY